MTTNSMPIDRSNSSVVNVVGHRVAVDLCCKPLYIKYNCIERLTPTRYSLSQYMANLIFGNFIVYIAYGNGGCVRFDVMWRKLMSS